MSRSRVSAITEFDVKKFGVDWVLIYDLNISTKYFGAKSNSPNGSALKFRLWIKCVSLTLELKP